MACRCHVDVIDAVEIVSDGIREHVAVALHLCSHARVFVAGVSRELLPAREHLTEVHVPPRVHRTPGRGLVPRRDNGAGTGAGRVSAASTAAQQVGSAAM